MIYLYDINKQNTEIFWAWVKWVCICLARFAGFVENRFSFVGCSLVTTVSRHPQCPHDDQIYLALPNTTNIPNMAIYTNLSQAFTSWRFDIWNDCHWIQVELRDDHKCGCAPRAWVLQNLWGIFARYLHCCITHVLEGINKILFMCKKFLKTSFQVINSQYKILLYTYYPPCPSYIEVGRGSPLSILGESLEMPFCCSDLLVLSRQKSLILQKFITICVMYCMTKFAQFF